VRLRRTFNNHTGAGKGMGRRRGIMSFVCVPFAVRRRTALSSLLSSYFVEDFEFGSTKHESGPLIVPFVAATDDTDHLQVDPDKRQTCQGKNVRRKTVKRVGLVAKDQGLECALAMAVSSFV